MKIQLAVFSLYFVLPMLAGCQAEKKEVSRPVKSWTPMIIVKPAATPAVKKPSKPSVREKELGTERVNFLVFRPDHRKESKEVVIQHGGHGDYGPYSKEDLENVVMVTPKGNYPAKLKKFVQEPCGCSNHTDICSTSVVYDYPHDEVPIVAISGAKEIKYTHYQPWRKIDSNVFKELVQKNSHYKELAQDKIEYYSDRTMVSAYKEWVRVIRVAKNYPETVVYLFRNKKLFMASSEHKAGGGGVWLIKLKDDGYIRIKDRVEFPYFIFQC